MGDLFLVNVGLKPTESMPRYLSLKVEVDMKIQILLILALFILLSQTEGDLSENELLINILSDDKTIVGELDANTTQLDRKAICRKLRKIRKQDETANELYRKLCKCRTPSTTMFSSITSISSASTVKLTTKAAVPLQIQFFCKSCQESCRYSDGFDKPYYCEACT